MSTGSITNQHIGNPTYIAIADRHITLRANVMMFSGVGLASTYISQWKLAVAILTLAQVTSAFATSTILIKA